MSRIHPLNKADCLEAVCAANYGKLMSLIPDLKNIDQSAIGTAPLKPDLQLEVLEQSRHTLTLKLSHRFCELPGEIWIPDVTVRMYLDAQLAEVIRDHARSYVSSVFKDPGKSSEILNYKWQLNYFLMKWLDHCLKTDYRFTENKTSEALA